MKSATLHTIYCFNPALIEPKRLNISRISDNRLKFLSESVGDLKNQIETIGLSLGTFFLNPIKVIDEYIKGYNLDAVFRSKTNSYYENRIWSELKAMHPDVCFEEYDSDTLFDETSLPFSIDELPETFSKFRKKVEKLEINIPNCSFSNIPKPLEQSTWDPKLKLFTENLQDITSEFKGGTQAGYTQLHNYFNSQLPSSYKVFRNELDGWENSTKFSAWLANGSISVRNVALRLKQYEAEIEQNDSTYWIGFELLWREYFHWYSKKYAQQLFQYKGIQTSRDKRCGLNCFYPERYQMWVNGNTPYLIVNACMKQLKATGYMSNRGRQIVASCFVNELQLDWRFGAAYFEQQLIDYDVATNWGNWQYLAGVGADPQPRRHVNLNKQTQLYDPNGDFIKKWTDANDSANSINKSKPVSLDSVDMVDWPIEQQ